MLAKRKGASREGWSEGSVEQSRESTNRNRIRGRSEWTSGPGIAKSISIKTPSCISGDCAAKVVGLTPGGLRCCPEFETEEAERRPYRSAEVSSGHSRQRNEPTPFGEKVGGLTLPKAQTVPSRTSVLGK